MDQTYTKKTLEQRWNVMPYHGELLRIQRDLYSAFLIQHVNPVTLDEIDVRGCQEDFEGFVALHQQEIRRLIQEPSRKLASMGL